jgi:hypothetical protein
MSYDDSDLRGVGGWLAFLIIILAIFSPINILVSTLQLYGDPSIAAVFGERWGLVQAVEILLSVLNVAGFWYVAWRLNSVHVWQSVRIAIAGLWILGLGVMAIEILAVAAIGGIPVGALIEGGAQDIVRGFVFGGVWTAYLLKSRRVANTYGEREENVAEVFA